MREFTTIGAVSLRMVVVIMISLIGWTSPARCDLISHWTFDGHTEDTVGGNDGNFQGDVDPFYVEGFDGNEAILFDGIDDLVVVQQNESLPLYNHPEFSIAMWVKGGPQPDFRVWSEGSTSDNDPLFNIGTQNGGATGQVDIMVRDGDGAYIHGHTLSTGLAFDDTWHHIAWVDAGGNATLYIDGSRDETDFTYAKPDMVLDTTTIGGILRANPSHYFIGAIDDVRIYDHALTEEEVRELVPEVECPAEGDTHCDDLSIEGPDDDGPGTYVVTVLDATDDTDDSILYTFRAESDQGDVVEVGPQPANTANLLLDEGTWTITVSVDDDPRCDDEADDAVCTGEITVVSNEPRMISHWTFDGDTADSQGNNDGNFEGFDLRFVDGFDGTEEGAILFDGIDDYVNVEQNDSLPLYDSPRYSIAMWVKGGPQPDRRVWSEGSTSDNDPLFNIGTQNGGATGQVDIMVRDGDGAYIHGHTLSTGIAFDNSWHHIVWVDANGDAALYIDGLRDATDFSYTRQTLELDTTTIGGILRAGPSHWFTGSIDDVRIYNYVLSEDEILELVEEVVCPAEGDTHCDDLIIEGPDDEGPGPYLVSVLGATDDSEESILYTFQAESDEGDLIEVGPQQANTASIVLSEGTWSITVVADDDPECDDEAADALCEAEITVGGGEPRMISHWKFDGDLEDSGDAGNGGIFEGGVEPEFVEGFDGTPQGAILFDGAAEYINVEHNESLPLYSFPTYSIAMWVKGLPQPDNRVYSEASSVENNSLFNIGTQNTGAVGTVDIYIRTADGVEVHGHTNSTLIAFDDEWHHIAWVDEKGQARMYIDGELDPTDFTYERPSLALDYTSIGAVVRPSRNPPECCLFNGAIDDMRIFNHALSEDEVLEIMEPDEDLGADLKPGDVNSDGKFDISDPIAHLDFLFAGGTIAECFTVPPLALTEAGLAILDFDGNDEQNLTDAVAALSNLFGGGPSHVLGADCVRLPGSCESNCQ